jgi:N-acetyl-gamma-glutamyl-phosphate reductase
VSETVQAYSIPGHRHSPEVRQELAGLAAGVPPRITLVTHLIPMVRGILVTCYFDLVGSVGELGDAYAEFYAGQPFTRLLDQTPTTKLASHTNLCLLNVAAQGPKAVVTAAIDNLVKGASGQGVECFNIAFGFDRTAGLEGVLQWP